MVIVLPIPITVLFMRNVVANGTAGDRTQHAMVHQMTGDPPDNGALEAAFRFGGRSRSNAQRGDHGKSEDEFPHAAHSHQVDET